MTAHRSRLRSSRYNFCVPFGEGDSVLYNAGSGASIRLAGSDVGEITELLCGPPREVATRIIPRPLLASLRRGGFLIEQAFDEVAAIRERYWVARGRTPMVLTLTTTQDCNLGCYYCYEERSRATLTAANVPAILDWTRERLAASGKDSLHVDWYGGEPLLNIAFIEVASAALQSLCNELNVSYSASVISNGTCWPDDVAGFIRRHRIRQAQISFDGLKANHDKRRRYRRGRAPEPSASSFEQAVALVDKLLDVVRVDLRFNADRGNADDLEPLVAFCLQRGWFDRPFACVFQLARISDYSERSGFMSQAKLSEDEFERLRERARHLVPNESNLDETTTRSLYPLPRTSVCAALADDSIVVGADGHRYRCGLQVGEKNRPIAMVGAGGQMSPGPDAPWWDTFDPTRQPNCSRCSFLPVCWGGCPKKHLEGDTASLHEQSLYWRKALPQKIAWQFGVAMNENTFAFSESDQFR
ncbi:radical SAM/SPASM domain-containing protein [Bradyrhizobium liaoningense]|uniref:radical SAM/SPASM domain-containing protein n=1 Tax=Bradyrhizobium liaoningense TaxID=43992 RepID=UPI001BA6571D|nr:radical SAM protein [Bradyrhizobium liaoningense]MBR0712845.1 SPASM domain-containing protein [Bradyrhizobium liaoningense]